jgi:hypothetical protein
MLPFLDSCHQLSNLRAQGAIPEGFDVQKDAPDEVCVFCKALGIRSLDELFFAVDTYFGDFTRSYSEKVKCFAYNEYGYIVLFEEKSWTDNPVFSIPEDFIHSDETWGVAANRMMWAVGDYPKVEWDLFGVETQGDTRTWLLHSKSRAFNTYRKTGDPYPAYAPIGSVIQTGIYKLPYLDCGLMALLRLGKDLPFVELKGRA